MRTVLLVSNRFPDEDAGRAEKISTRMELFANRGWHVELSHVPEPYGLTFPLSIARTVSRIRELRPDVLVSMNNPFHLHLIGYVAAQITGVPWVAEFRDPIRTHPDWDPDESVLRRMAGFVERLTVEQADRVVWLDGIQIPKDYFRRTYPDVSAEKLVELPPMGFDAERFDAIEPASFDEFTVTYAGSFYNGWIEPYGFLDGLARFIRDDLRPITARFYGDWKPSYGEAVAERDLSQYVAVHDFVDHDRMISILKGSDALLYIGGTDERNRRNLPSKIWDYLGAERPILALVDDSFRVAEFVESNGLGVVVDPTDPVGVAEGVESLYTGGFQYNPPESTISTYTRQRQADAYTAVLDGVVEGGDDGPLASEAP